VRTCDVSTHWAWLALLAVACGSSPAPGQGQSSGPVIHRFEATPGALAEGGGTVSLSWDVAGATRLSVDPGVGTVTPVTTGSLEVAVTEGTRFSLRATGEDGSTSLANADVTVPGTCRTTSRPETGTCYIFRSGRCRDYSNLSADDVASLPEFCTALDGTWSDSLCPTENRIGTCKLPPSSPYSGITCSPAAIVLERFYAPSFTVQSAQIECSYVPGATFTRG
jgi:hypothetical protein